jgi:addiction module HigA family antidote
MNGYARSVAMRPFHFLKRLIKGRSAISPEMALRLSKCLGRSAESWLRMQDIYDLWKVRQRIDLSEIEPLVVPV